MNSENPEPINNFSIKSIPRGLLINTEVTQNNTSFKNCECSTTGLAIKMI